MKEKITNLVKIARSRYGVQSGLLRAAIVAVLVLLIAGAGVFAFAATSSKEAINVDASKTKVAVEQPAISVAVVGADNLASASGTLGNSWPGEIISSQLSQIQPQREGVITDWRVRIGDVVSAGDILGKISAPPATPELIGMLTEKTEALTMAKSGADIADEYAAKEKARLETLEKTITGSTSGINDSLPTTLSRMREKVETKRAALRSFIEKALSAQILKTSRYTDWRQIGSGINLSSDLYGGFSQQLQIDYGWSAALLAAELKKSTAPPIETASKYFTLAVQLGEKSIIGSDPSVDEFRTMAADDKKEFLEALADYQESMADLADKETEYQLMISEKKAMLEKDRLMAHAEVAAKEASYGTVANQIKDGLYIIAPRGGTVSAIYKNVGDLVDPAMKIAAIAGGNANNLLVRMRIPNNIRKPSVGESVHVTRPGFPADMRIATITGVGAVLDEDGSYMADATLTEKTDWSAGASVRVIPPQNMETPLIQFSAVWWSKTGLPHIWGVSEAGRIFARKITIGRTIGSSVEVYDGIKNGDSYIVTTTPAIAEDMLLSDVPHENVGADSSDTPKEKKPMGGMEM
jgi:multidrug efflux pump subunit AcrA (membrane-fusion protein)